MGIGTTVGMVALACASYAGQCSDRVLSPVLKSFSSAAQKEALDMALPLATPAVRATKCTSVMKEPSTISLELRSLNVASWVGMGGGGHSSAGR